jgi:uncharacterized protein
VDEPTPAPIGPVPADERITVIDCLRGAALFGILMANMRAFHAPLAAYIRADLLWTWMPDRIAQALVDWLISGKFITIFAALFGIGFAIQLDRAAARGRDLSFFARRMRVLLIIGLAHSLLLWWGDILVTYAICGLFLVAFREAPQRTLLAWGHALYWFVAVLFVGFFIASLFGAEIPPDEPNRIQETIQAYAHGTIAQVFAVRLQEWLSANSFFVIFGTRVLGIFLFGVYLWRQGYLARPGDYIEWWRRALRVGLPIGLIGNALAVALEWRFHPDPDTPSLVTSVIVIVQSVATPALSLAYAAIVMLLWQQPAWRRRLLPFSFVGRMALTNYLLQSLIFTTVFYSYGLGLYGRVGPLVDVPLAIVVYSLQIPFSMWWLRTHRYGPMEWLWRRFTYGPIDSATA